MVNRDKEKECILLLRERHAALREAGEDRYPKRSDFTVEEVVAIKACFGPWPRALEAAGIKPVNVEKQTAKRQKRIEKKREATRQKREGKHSSFSE